MSSWLKFADSNSTTLFEDQKHYNNNDTENNAESSQHQTSVEPNTNPTENTQQRPLQIHDSSYSQIFAQ